MNRRSLATLLVSAVIAAAIFGIAPGAADPAEAAPRNARATKTTTSTTSTSTSTSTTTTTTVPAGTSTAPGAGACTGVSVGVADDLQAKFDAHPEGTTFCVSSGVHRMTRPARAKSGNIII